MNATGGALTDVELHEQLLVEVLVALSTLTPNALTRDTSSHRVTIRRDAVARLVATVDQLAPGALDTVRSGGSRGRLRRPG